MSVWDSLGPARSTSGCSASRTSFRSYLETKKAIENAIDEKLAEFDATGRGFAVKDIYWALGGIGLRAFGNALSLVDKLST